MDYLTVIYSSIQEYDEVARWSAIHLFKEWISKTHSSNPTMTLENYHTIMNAEAEKFNQMKRYINWGDSFMIEHTNVTGFRNGCNHRIVDFPEIKIPFVGQVVMIDGVEHTISEFGFLTFNAYCADDMDDSSSDVIDYEEYNDTNCADADMAAGH